MIRQVKNVLLGAAVFCTSLTLNSTVDGNDCCYSGCGFDGFYVGGSVGFVTSVSQYVHKIPLTHEDFTSDFGLLGVDGGVQIGYGRTFDVCCLSPFYLGIEGAAIFSNAEGVDDVTAQSIAPPIFIEHKTTARIRNSYQAAIRIGLPLCNVAMPYFKIGYTNTRWEVIHEHSEDFETLGFGDGQLKKHLSGLLLGAGVDFLFCKHFVLGGLFDFSLYKKQHFPIAQPIDPTAFISFLPRYSRVALRLSYLF